MRLVAILVAQGAPLGRLFAEVAEQVAQVLPAAFVSIVRHEADRTATGDVAVPIVVAGRPWGAIVVSAAEQEALPADTEARLADFADLVATAIANTEARAETERLTQEQSALRRAATLVAREAPPAEVFAAVAREVAGLLGVESTAVLRFDEAGGPTVVARWGELTDTRSSASSPIAVDGRPWGAVLAATTGLEPLPADTEARLRSFTDLVAMAISNTDARTEVARLVVEQAALRRMATLVARASPAAEVFAAVAEEVGRLLGVESTAVARTEDDETATFIARWGERTDVYAVGTKVSFDGESVLGRVLRTGRAVRNDGDTCTTSGERARATRELGIRSAVGSPIVVDGRLWGVMGVATTRREPLPANTEARVGEFTELVATAISNIQTRSELAASRTRIVRAADEERRRVVRDLHDAAQLRLARAVATLEQAREARDEDEAAVARLLDEALVHVRQAMTGLRELAHGIRPHALTRGGLRTGLNALAGWWSSVPLTLDVPRTRFAASVEATAYVVVAGALTNVARHAHANAAWVTVRADDGSLTVEVRDDGVGGARADGPGLVGMRDRVAALEGRLRVESPPGRGTLIAATIPLSP